MAEVLKSKITKWLGKIHFIFLLSCLSCGDKTNKPFEHEDEDHQSLYDIMSFCVWCPDAWCIAILHVSREFVRHAQTFINWC